MPALLRRSGVHTHLCSDHHHYWELGGATYHCQYSTWNGVRGQEGDPWFAHVSEEHESGRCGRNGKPNKIVQDRINRSHITADREQPIYRTFDAGLEFIDRNRKTDDWFLHIEAFDPHEPFVAGARHRRMYSLSGDDARFEWPQYGHAPEDADTLSRIQRQYAAVVSQCDENLGRVLDVFDQYQLWDDTLLIVNTDHGLLLGEHESLGKMKMPFYEEVVRIPLFIWDHRFGQRSVRRKSLVQTIDLTATLLDYFGVALPDAIQGMSLEPVISGDWPVRTGALFGMFGGHVNYSDGRFVYMRGAASDTNQPLFEYTTLPMHMTEFFDLRLLRPESMTLFSQFGFTKGGSVLRITVPDAEPGMVLENSSRVYSHSHTDTLLFDLSNDPKQQQPSSSAELESRMIEELTNMMRQSEAPAEQFTRLGLDVRD
jgi:arylsulfatase A-like enzyme